MFGFGGVFEVSIIIQSLLVEGKGGVADVVQGYEKMTSKFTSRTKAFGSDAGLDWELTLVLQLAFGCDENVMSQ